MISIEQASTGIKGLDKVIQNLYLGDNVVWQVDKIQDYKYFVTPYINSALEEGKKIVYIRFARHEPLIEYNKNIKYYELDAELGFETFTKKIHEIIANEGLGAYYLFDCLSDLLYDWASDLMIGNFFVVTCPYLFRLKTIAYFAILRNNHSYKTIARIRETTQLLLDVYNFEKQFYLHPLKVWKRYSPTMYLPHQEKENQFIPITNSVDATSLFAYIGDQGFDSTERRLDYWDRLFLKAEEINREGTEEDKCQMMDQLCKVVIGREPRILELAKKHFTLEDILNIKSRMIGTGLIGGKAVGMLLARKILINEGGFDYIEAHDSYFIGCDVFYSYVVENGWWGLWLEQKSEKGYFEKANDLKERLLNGKFPDEIKEQFNQMLDYFGQSPIIVRSSSLLEDSFGNAFAGKYESIFCVNQGSPEKRYLNYEAIVKEVFASTMNEDALMYRITRGLGQQDEQMALLVQRVSGNQYQKYYFPFLAGVGVSYNSYVWSKDIDPKAGLLRLVFGLGTRAVNRIEGDYPRNLSLNAPLLKPYSGMNDERKYAQHEVDVLNIEMNEFQTIALSKLLMEEPNVNISIIGKRDFEAEKKMNELGFSNKRMWILTFEDLINKTLFIDNMKKILETLEKHYQYPVDIEYTVNFKSSGQLQINIVQCRPLQAKIQGKNIQIPKNIEKEKIIISSTGGFMGGNLIQPIRRIIYIDCKSYKETSLQNKYAVARLIGKLNKELGKGNEILPTMIIGPGRWGTKDAALGVPVTFAEVNNYEVMVEVSDPLSGFNPDLSFGSHFFLDLVEANIFYIALFLENNNVFFNKEWIEKESNIIEERLLEDIELKNVVKIINCDIALFSDISSQEVLLAEV